jgi:hypothetical protein
MLTGVRVVNLRCELTYVYVALTAFWAPQQHWYRFHVFLRCVAA